MKRDDTQEDARNRADTTQVSKAQAWLLANREAIAAYNRHVDEHGVFSDGVRRF